MVTTLFTGRELTVGELVAFNIKLEPGDKELELSLVLKGKSYSKKIAIQR